MSEKLSKSKNQKQTNKQTQLDQTEQELHSAWMNQAHPKNRRKL